MTASYNVYRKDNVIDKIIKGELPSKKVFEDETVIAFLDIAPAAPTHILGAPKKAAFSFDEFVANSTAEEVGAFFKKVQKIASEAPGLQEQGYRIVMNHGMFAEQIVPHFHAHIIGGRVLGAMTTVPDHTTDNGDHSQKKAPNA